MKSIAKIIGTFFNHIFGKKDKPKNNTPVTECRDAEGTVGDGSSTKSTVIMIPQPVEDDEVCEPQPIEDEVTQPQPVEYDRKKIMKMIKEMIKGESKQKPLYDTELLAALQKAGYDLTVRTVCRYRNDMDIDSRKERLEDYRDEAEKRRKKRRKKDSCD